MKRHPDDEKCARKLRRIAKREDYDIENQHAALDFFLCEILLKHGYVKTVEAYRKIEKYYG